MLSERETRLVSQLSTLKLSTNLHLFPAFTAERVTGDTPDPATIGSWEIVSSYSSATAPVSHRISRADPLDQTRKELIQQYRLSLPRSRLISPFRYETAAERQNHAPGYEYRLLFRQVLKNFVAICSRNNRPWTGNENNRVLLRTASRRKLS